MARTLELGPLLTVPAVAGHLPMWTEWGVRDAGHLIHSLGCSFLTAAGANAGFSAVTEVPAPRTGSSSMDHIEEDVRSDSVWFDRGSRRVALIAEFERYCGKQKDLSPKVETLLLASHRWGCSDATLLLAYWTIGLVSVPQHAALRSIVRDGFSATGGVRVPGNPNVRVAFFQFVVQEGQDHNLRLSTILQRGEA